MEEGSGAPLENLLCLTEKYEFFLTNIYLWHRRHLSYGVIRIINIPIRLTISRFELRFEAIKLITRNSQFPSRSFSYLKLRDSGTISIFQTKLLKQVCLTFLEWQILISAKGMSPRVTLGLLIGIVVVGYWK